MTKKERVISALEHKTSDIIPYHIDFTMQAHNNMIAYTKDKEYYSKMSTHLHYVQYWGYPTQIENHPDFYKDDFGVIWNRSGADKDIGVVDNVLINDIENIAYQFPEINEKKLQKEFDELSGSRNDRFTFAGIGFSMFERLWSLMGMTEVLMGMLTHPKETHMLFERIYDYNCKIMDIALKYNLDGFYFGDDWGQQKGLIMGPELWRKYIKPNMARLYKKAKDKGLYVIQHSCGDIESIFPDLIEIGLDCYQTFQPEIYDIKKVKEEFGRDMAFWGGISTQRLLSRQNPETVKKEIIRTMRIMGEKGGYIAAPTHAVEFDVPPENIIAMVDVFKNQDKFL